MPLKKVSILAAAICILGAGIGSEKRGAIRFLRVSSGDTCQADGLTQPMALYAKLNISMFISLLIVFRRYPMYTCPITTATTAESQSVCLEHQGVSKLAHRTRR